MSKKIKIWLIVAVSLILIGCIIFVGVMTMLKWDFTKLSTSKYQTNNYEITESFKDVSIKANTAKIEFVVSDNEKFTVSCYEREKVFHKVEVKENTLIIEKVDNRKWYEYIGFDFSSPKIIVSIPAGEYGELFVKASTGKVTIAKDFKFNSIEIMLSAGDVSNYASAQSVKIKTSTGDICVDNITTNLLGLSTSTGKISALNVSCEEELSINVTTGKSYLENITCTTLISNGSTGNVSLKSVVVAGKMQIERSTGDIKFDECDAGEIYVKTSTGNVKGTLKTEKIFIVNTDTGRKDVPKTSAGGICEITTDTGDIIISIS